jgi:hypothetical protein
VGTSFAGVLYVLRATWKALRFGDNLAERMNWRVPTVLLHRYEQAFQWRLIVGIVAVSGGDCGDSLISMPTFDIKLDRLVEVAATANMASLSRSLLHAYAACLTVEDCAKQLSGRLISPLMSVGPS